MPRMLFFQLINVKTPTIVGVLTLTGMGRKKFHAQLKSFITSGPVVKGQKLTTENSIFSVNSPVSSKHLPSTSSLPSLGCLRLVTQKEMAKIHIRRPPFMFPVVVVIGFILWKYVNGSDSLDPNLDCKVGCKVFADGSLHCFASVRKLGNQKSLERLRCFKSSKATNLAILIILAGDIETNPGPRSKCARCRTK